MNAHGAKLSRWAEFDAVSRVYACDGAVRQHRFQRTVDALTEFVVGLHHPDRHVPVEVWLRLEGTDRAKLRSRMGSVMIANAGMAHGRGGDLAARYRVHHLVFKGEGCRLDPLLVQQHRGERADLNPDALARLEIGERANPF